MDAIARFITSAAPIQSDRLLSVDISPSGRWTQVIDADDLVAGAGSDPTEQYQSVQDAAIIDTGNVGFYDIYVAKSDDNWNSNLVLYIKLMGAGKCSVSGRSTSVILTLLNEAVGMGIPEG